MARENKSQYAILGLLSKRNYSAYDMKQKINQIAHFHWSESNAQLYPLLKDLEKKGMVKSQIDPASGDRKKRVYEITSAGLHHLKLWLEKPAVRSQYREEILLKLALGEHLPTTTLINHLQDYQTQIHEQQKLLIKMVNHINENYSKRVDLAYLQATYDYADIVLKAKAQWVENTLRKFSREK